MILSGIWVWWSFKVRNKIPWKITFIQLLLCNKSRFSNVKRDLLHGLSCFFVEEKGGGMKRAIFTDLLEWRNNPHRKPLLLYGARQVGKTHTLKHFAKTAYHDQVYLNFEDTPALKKYFETSLDPKDIIYKLSIHFNKSILPQNTLLIFF